MAALEEVEEEAGEEVVEKEEGKAEVLPRLKWVTIRGKLPQSLLLVPRPEAMEELHRTARGGVVTDTVESGENPSPPPPPPLLPTVAPKISPFDRTQLTLQGTPPKDTEMEGVGGVRSLKNKRRCREPDTAAERIVGAAPAEPPDPAAITSPKAPTALTAAPHSATLGEAQGDKEVYKEALAKGKAEGQEVERV